MFVIAFPEFQSSLLETAAFFQVTLLGTVVALPGLISRWCGGRCAVWGSLLTVLSVVVCHLAVVEVFSVGLISSRAAPASDASTVAPAITVCVSIHGCAKVTIGMTDVLSGLCGCGLLLDGGYDLLD